MITHIQILAIYSFDINIPALGYPHLHFPRPSRHLLDFLQPPPQHTKSYWFPRQLPIAERQIFIICSESDNPQPFYLVCGMAIPLENFRLLIILLKSFVDHSIGRSLKIANSLEDL